MKLLIFGSRGWIGSMFINYLKSNNINFIETNVRADNEALVNDIILLHSPSHIISFIGRTYDNDNNDNDGELVDNVRDNLFGPVVLSMLAQKHNIHYTYLGNGCIFNNDTTDENHYIYDENDNADFNGSSYLIVKGFTDRLIKLNANALNLRIKMPIVDFNHSRNFITNILNNNNISSFPNSITVLPVFFPIILDMIKNKTIGTFNLVNPGIISQNEILEMYKEIIDPSFTWDNFNKIFKSNTSNNHMNSNKICALYPDIPDIKTAIRNCLINMKEET